MTDPADRFCEAIELIGDIVERCALAVKIAYLKEVPEDAGADD